MQTAGQLAVAFPDRMQSLLLASTFARTNAQARHFLEAVASVYQCGASSKQIYDLIVPWLFSLPFFNDPRAEPFLEYPDDVEVDQSLEDWLRLLAAQLAFDGRNRLPLIDAPTLILAGADDRLVPLEDAEHLAHGISGAVLHILQGGHLINIESPHAFEQEILNFLSVNSHHEKL
jgi:3-oxoadipate enol-lactonase